MNRIIALLALVLTSLVVVAGCGGDDEEGLSTDEYASELDAEFETFNREFAELGPAAADPASPEAYIDAVTAIQDRVGETVAEIEAIEPPEEAADFQEDLLDAMTGLQDSFGPVIEATEAEDRAALQDAAVELQESTADFQREITDLAAQAEEEGYPIESLAGAAP